MEKYHEMRTIFLEPCQQKTLPNYIITMSISASTAVTLSHNYHHYYYHFFFPTSSCLQSPSVITISHHIHYHYQSSPSLPSSGITITTTIITQSSSPSSPATRNSAVTTTTTKLTRKYLTNSCTVKKRIYVHYISLRTERI